MATCRKSADLHSVADNNNIITDYGLSRFWILIACRIIKGLDASEPCVALSCLCVHFLAGALVKVLSSILVNALISVLINALVGAFICAGLGI